MAAHQGFVVCQTFDLPSSLCVSNAASSAVSWGYGSQSELHKGKLCLIFLLDCICYFPAISSPWCLILQASGLMVSNCSRHASQRGLHTVLWNTTVPLCRASSCFTIFSLQILQWLLGTNGSLEKRIFSFPS